MRREGVGSKGRRGSRGGLLRLGYELAGGRAASGMNVCS